MSAQEKAGPGDGDSEHPLPRVETDPPERQGHSLIPRTPTGRHLHPRHSAELSPNFMIFQQIPFGFYKRHVEY